MSASFNPCFQAKSGALLDPKILEATPRVDQGLMVLIDRNLDRFKKILNKEITSEENLCFVKQHHLELSLEKSTEFNI